MQRYGHRGACGYAPENTLASFAKALGLGVDGVELDIHICASGEPVVIHDHTLERTTNGKGRVGGKTLDELQRLDAGQGEKIPTLAEVLALMQGKGSVFIELKSNDSVRPVLAVINQAVRLGWELEKLIVIAFNHHLLADAKQLLPALSTGALLAAKPLHYAECASDICAFSVNPAHEFVDSAFVTDAHKRGLKLITWTVNAPEEIARLKALGVDGIFSDYPDRL